MATLPLVPSGLHHGEPGADPVRLADPQHGDLHLDGDEAGRLARLARPLLALLQRITGLETSFVTEIDWVAQRQEVVVALNTSDVLVAEGSEVDWADSMCRTAFLSTKGRSSDVPADFPSSYGTELGMQTFFAVPIVDGDATLGTVCGASRRSVALGEEEMEIVGLVSQALAEQVRADIVARARLARAAQAASAANERVAQLLAAAQEMEALALTDALTGLPNRRSFDARWEEELVRSARHDHPIALLLVDVDEFKCVNDVHGHGRGDDVLRTLADVLRTISRIEDVVARIGGDEFAVGLPHASAAGAVALGQRIRAGFSSATGMACTVSVGVGSSEHIRRDQLMAAADMALYRGKRLGRDRVELWAGGDQGSGSGPVGGAGVAEAGYASAGADAGNRSASHDVQPSSARALSP